MPAAHPSPTDLRARMTTIDRELTAIRGCGQDWDASKLARRNELEAEHRAHAHTLYTLGEDPPRRNNGWGKH